MTDDVRTIIVKFRKKRQNNGLNPTVDPRERGPTSG
jgi:hypothetical protein